MEKRETMRLQQYLARAGIASRRRSEELIAAGRVRVNGDVVTEMGRKVDLETDEVTFDGVPVKEEKHIYICFYKPPHVVASAYDPQGRKTVQDFMQGVSERVFNVGRLDYDSEGVLLMTNDGDLANGLMHPRFEVKKTYYVICRGHLTDHEQALLRKGVDLDGRKTAKAELEILEELRSTTRLNITIHEGRNRQVRRMFEAIGHQVAFLRREAFGNLTLDTLSPGRWRYLEGEELAELRRQAGLIEGEMPKKLKKAKGKRKKQSLSGQRRMGRPRRGNPTKGGGEVQTKREWKEKKKRRRKKNETNDRYTL